MPNTINPYKSAFRMVGSRLLWDLNYKSFIARNKLKKIRNKYNGEKCIIICNGPSLLDVDFDVLIKSNIKTFGLNKIDLLFDKTKFRPDFIVAVNPHVIDQNIEFYRSTTIPLFLDKYASKKIKKNKNNITYLHSSIERSVFAQDCSVSICQGHTVTYAAMQLAFHMGFKNVALIGCDHSFASKGEPNKTVISEETDPNHFDPNYFAGGVKWQLPDLFQSEVHYYFAKENFESIGGSIVNASSHSKLELFDRVKLTEFLG